MLHDGSVKIGQEASGLFQDACKIRVPVTWISGASSGILEQTALLETTRSGGAGPGYATVTCRQVRAEFDRDLIEIANRLFRIFRARSTPTITRRAL